jgi:hypothetical protein
VQSLLQLELHAQVLTIMVDSHSLYSQLEELKNQSNNVSG